MPFITKSKYPDKHGGLGRTAPRPLPVPFSMPAFRFLSVVLLLILSIWLIPGCLKTHPNDPVEDILGSLPDRYDEVLTDPEQYDFQVIYTQINRDEHNLPHFSTWSFPPVDPAYFYPASTVKLPVAILALERINELGIAGLTARSGMITDSAYSGQTSVYYDSTSRSLRPSVAHYIKKIFLVSDNDAFNRLYEFLGPQYIHEKLHDKGYKETGILHRLSVFLTEDENRHTNPVRFFNGDKMVYEQPPAVGPVLFTDRKSIRLGKGYLSGDSLVAEPMDFTRKNFMSLNDLHHILIEVIFPGALYGKPLFQLQKADYDLLYRYMSMYPSESDFPFFGDHYDDNYCKFLMFGNHFEPIPRNLRIFNKVGVAYGFVIDAAYIVDFENRVEFFLSTVLNVNLNRIYNDGVYAYDSLGFPFFEELGKAFYAYELNRKKTFQPDLNRFIFDY